MVIHIKDGEFTDEHGRVLNLRGINLGGSSKIPTNNNNITNWLDAKTITFVNRPFPISEAALHFTRIRACGFTIIRFIITWEAIEHEGPGIYDYEYIQYVRSILTIAKDHDIYVYIDPHQDVWSRWTGGDGAPLWTLELVGFDVANFRECEAAITQKTYGQGHSTAEKKCKSFPKMIWPTNYFKLATATMFTLFWAGERFAPQFMVDDYSESSSGSKKVNIQSFLQKHYINAMAELLKSLNGLDNIVGIGTMNEPSAGYINVADLSQGYGQSGVSSDPGSKELKYGLAPSPFQGMCLGEGYKQIVGDWSNGIMQHILGKCDRLVSVDPKGKRAWKKSNNNPNGECIWKQAGVWRINPTTSQPELLHPNYFSSVDFGTECYLPFAKEYANVMRSTWKSQTQELLMFVELPPLEFSSTPFPNISPSIMPNAVNATHWYDGITLFTRTFKRNFSVNTTTHKPIFGSKNILNNHVSQLRDIKRLGDEKMQAPTLIGETGIPYDMVETTAMKLKRKLVGSVSIDFQDTSSLQLQAMNHTLCCLEKNMLAFTLWNYTSDNTSTEGDIWNGEDLSVYSEDYKCNLDKTHPYFIYDGLRAARAFVRPYAQCIAGEPVVNEFDLRSSTESVKSKYLLIYIQNGGSEKSEVSTEVFVPKLWCLTKADMNISVSDGRFEIEEQNHWFIVKYWHYLTSMEHKLEIEHI